MSFYGPDLAYVHALGYTALAEGAAGVALPRLAPGARVLEVGCGDGTTARRLCDAGVDVTAIDIAPAMVARAREHAPDARVSLRSALDDDLPRELDAILAIGEVLSYVLPDAPPRSTLLAALRHLVPRLRPGGFMLLDFITPERVPVHPERSWTAIDAWAALVENRRGDDGLLRREILTFREQSPATFRRSREVHRQAAHTQAEIVDELERLGCRVETMQLYGDVALPRGTVGVLAYLEAE